MTISLATDRPSLGFTGNMDTYKPAEGSATRSDIAITDPDFKYPSLWKLCFPALILRRKKILRSVCLMWEEYDKDTLLSYEKEVLGIYLSGHPLERYSSMMEKMISDKNNRFPGG